MIFRLLPLCCVILILFSFQNDSISFSVDAFSKPCLPIFPLKARSVKLNWSSRNLASNFFHLSTTSLFNEIPTATAAATTGESFVPKLRIEEKIIGISALASLFLTFASLIRISGRGSWRYYLAGGICACVSHSITTPIDVVKTRQQVSGIDGERNNMFFTARRIIKEEGFRQGLLSGLGPTAVGYLFEGALKFGVYESLKRPVCGLLGYVPVAFPFRSIITSKILGLIIAGALSGLAASIVLCPLEALRIRLVSEPHFTEHGWMDGGLIMLEEEGINGMTKGMTAMMSKQIPYTVTKQVTFDCAAHKIFSLAKFRLSEAVMAQTNIKFVIVFLSAIITSILTCLTSQPGDMLLSVVNAHQGGRRTRSFAKDIWKKDGLKGFFVGVNARLLHVSLMVTTQLIIYDMVKQMVGIVATGSGGLE